MARLTAAMPEHSNHRSFQHGKESDTQFAVGAPGYNGVGAVMLFNRQFQSIEQIGPQEGQLDFGLALSLDGEDIAIGAPGSNSDSGEVVVVIEDDLIFRDDFE